MTTAAVDLSVLSWLAVGFVALARLGEDNEVAVNLAVSVVGFLFGLAFGIWYTARRVQEYRAGRKAKQRAH